MRLFSRLTTSISSSFDVLISRIENHDALAASAIREATARAAKAKVRLHRIRRDLDDMKQRKADLEQKQEHWARRACEIKETEPDKAIECFRRHKQAVAEVKYRTEEINKHEALQLQLTEDVRKIEERVAELKRKRNAYAARESRSDALNMTQMGEVPFSADMDEIFDRWEEKLVESEIGTVSDLDTFEAEFERTEDRETLEAELDAFMADQNKTTDN